MCEIFIRANKQEIQDWLSEVYSLLSHADNQLSQLKDSYDCLPRAINVQCLASLIGFLKEISKISDGPDISLENFIRLLGASKE